VLVHIAITKDAAGRTIQLRGANQDITERKKSEQELRNLWRAVEQTPATVVITNVSGNIEYVNPKFVEITGYSVAEALGQNPRVLKSGCMIPSFYKAMWDTLLQGNVWQGEIATRRRTATSTGNRPASPRSAIQRGRLRTLSRSKKTSPNATGFVRCEITDTGIGIPAEKQARLFQLFSQADSSTTRKYGGTGLGLAISKRLVELMGGQIGLNSEADKGSTFWFTLPTGVSQQNDAPGPVLTAVASTRAASDNGIHPQSPARFRVLLAEDNYINQKLAVHLLRRLSCDVDVAANGKEAVALAARQPFDLIFMDCLMPEMNGLEASREIRRAENGIGRVPIIAITACVTECQRERCRAAGMDDFIEKPMQDQELERALQKWAFSAGNRQPEKSLQKINGYENVDH
jgi:CheY-like chemotaxis protein/PAS domain-containing protein